AAAGAVQHEGDVAVRAAAGRAAGAAVDRGDEPAAVEQQDRLAAVLGDPAERGEERRGERVAELPAQVDDGDRRHPPRQAPAERQPLEPGPALRPRRGAAEHRDRALERGALGRHRPRVVARIGLLLVRRVVLLVDAHEPEPTTTRASPEAIRSRSSRRSASVIPEWRTAIRSPKRTRKRPTACGVSAISGTSTIAPSPRSSAAAQAWR